MGSFIFKLHYIIIHISIWYFRFYIVHLKLPVRILRKTVWRETGVACFNYFFTGCSIIICLNYMEIRRYVTVFAFFPESYSQRVMFKTFFSNFYLKNRRLVQVSELKIKKPNKTINIIRVNFEFFWRFILLKS